MDFEKIFKALEAKLDDTLSNFKGTKDELDSLKQTVAELQQKVVDVASKMMTAKVTGEEFGFQDEDTAKSFCEFAKGILTGDVQSVKDMTEGTDSEGGYLVPTEFRAVLLRMIEKNGLIRQGATILPMTKSEMNIPALTSGVNVYWIDEGQTINTTQPVFGNVNLTVKKMAALVPVTSELLEDSSIAIANLIATLFAEAIAKEEDVQGFIGNGSPFTGILNNVDVNLLTMDSGKVNFSDVTADDLADLIDSIPTGYATGAKFYLHRTIFNVIRKLKDTTGNYIYSPPTAGQPGMIWGYPYQLTEVMPTMSQSAADTPFICFGNLKNVYLGDRKKMSIAQSTHFAFNQDKTYLRTIERIALTVALPKTFAVLKTAAA